MKFRIYHNMSCSKSCNALAELGQVKNSEIEVVDYIAHPPTEEELKSIISMLGIKPLELIRQNEPEFTPYLNRPLTGEECIRLMARHPVLIQRPIVIKGDKAIILRPPLTLENLL
jgi:arsenate reductase (glutaredoxin)